MLYLIIKQEFDHLSNFTYEQLSFCNVCKHRPNPTILSNVDLQIEISPLSLHVQTQSLMCSFTKLALSCVFNKDQLNHNICFIDKLSSLVKQHFVNLFPPN